jgi:hypothetical protein
MEMKSQSKTGSAFISGATGTNRGNGEIATKRHKRRKHSTLNIQLSTQPQTVEALKFLDRMNRICGMKQLASTLSPFVAMLLRRTGASPTDTPHLCVSGVLAVQIPQGPFLPVALWEKFAKQLSVFADWLKRPKPH